jgi:molybdopterin-guanine dinucleotide biosynthesis protein A
MSRTTAKRLPGKKKAAVVIRASGKREPAVVRLPAALKKRLKMKLAEDGRKFQDVAEELITRYVDGDLTHSTDLELQVQAARASMRKNAVALRELAK